MMRLSWRYNVILRRAGRLPRLTSVSETRMHRTRRNENAAAAAVSGSRGSGCGARTAPNLTDTTASHWLSDEGPLSQLTSDLARSLTREFTAEPYGWYFYFSDSNAFLYWTAREVSFDWEGSARPAA